MPNDDAIHCAHRHDRIPAKWADITYKPGVNGTLQGRQRRILGCAGLSGGRFKASDAVDDGISPGHENSYTPKPSRKRLMPVPQPENNYFTALAGLVWISRRGTGPEIKGDNPPPGLPVYGSGSHLTAHFEEKPGCLVQIAFEAGSHGSINAGQPLTLRNHV